MWVLADLNEPGVNTVIHEISDSHAGHFRLRTKRNQTRKQRSFGCFYTRTTGIWQSVWLERTPAVYLKRVYFTPDIEECAVKVEVETEGCAPVHIQVFYQGRRVGEAHGEAAFRRSFRIPLTEKHLWELGEGNLYDVEISLGEDHVRFPAYHHVPSP